MATVRIYKVAELLGTTSQEVMALLKRDHGIEVKSASSTIEEVVARQFVEWLARQRNIVLPSGDHSSFELRAEEAILSGGAVNQARLVCLKRGDRGTFVIVARRWRRHICDVIPVPWRPGILV